MSNTTDIKQTLKALPKAILKGNVDLDAEFNKLSNNIENKKKVIDKVLEVLRKNQMSLRDCENVTRRVCLELPRLPPEALTRWCNDSIQSIIDDSDVNMIWCDILPECMYALSSLDTISFYENNETVTISSKEYKKRCLQKLLGCNFKKRQLMQLATMSKDLQLPRIEHRKFVTKICAFIKDMPPEDLPSLIHQLVKLCRSQNLKVVLAYLSDYFNLQMYNKITTPLQDSESTTTMEIEDTTPYNEIELQRCLSTCVLFLTHEPAPLLRELREWPRSQLPRAPLALLLALALTEKGKDFRAACLDVMRLAIETSVVDERLSREFAAARSVLRPDVSITALLETIVESEGLCPKIINGLIHLCFALLANRKTKADRQACANIGVSVLVKVAKVHQFAANQILYIMADRLASDSGNPYYAECLSALCKETLSVEPQAKLRDILQECRARSPGVLEAVQPLLNFSSGVRDALIMTCTKRLYFREPEERALAARGLLAALRALRGRGGARDARGDVHVHASQEGDTLPGPTTSKSTCENIIMTLRRCLGQEASVKELLYSRWYACVQDKPALHDELLDMLHGQLSKYLSEGDTNLCLDKCVQTNASGAVLIEPIGRLLYLIAQLVQSTSVESNMEGLFSSQGNSSNFIRSKLKKYLADLSKCDLLANIDMENLTLTDPTPESKASCMKVQQLLQVYEALIAHHVMQWSPAEGRADTVYRLYKEHNQLLENTKQSPKKSAAKKPRLTKDKSRPFKPLPCLWDMSLCYRVLELNYGDQVAWSSTEERTELRSRGVWQRWAARAVAAAVAACDVGDASVHARVLTLAALLYDRCLCRFQDVYDFDDDTALGCLEAFHACLKLYASNLNVDSSVLPVIIGDSTASVAASKAHILGTLRATLFKEELLDASQPANELNRKVAKELMDVTTTLLTISTDESRRADSNDNIKLIREISEWEERVCASVTERAALVPPLLGAAAAAAPDAALLDALLTRLADVDAGTGPDPQTQNERLSWVTASNAASLVVVVTSHATARLTAAKQTIQRARDLADMRERSTDANLPRNERELCAVYESCVLQLSVASRRARVLCASRAGAPPLRHAATLLAAAAALPPPPPAVAHRLENLIKLLGNQFIVSLKKLGAHLKTQPLGSKDYVRLMPVKEAAKFRNFVYSLDANGKLNYRQYVTENLAEGFATNSTEDDEMESADEERDVDITEAENDRAYSDSDAETVHLD